LPHLDPFGTPVEWHSARGRCRSAERPADRRGVAPCRLREPAAAFATGRRLRGRPPPSWQAAATAHR